MSLHNKVGGAWKTLTEAFVHVGGTWKPCGDVFIRVAGVWKSTLYEAGSQTITATGSGSFTVPSGVYSLTISVMGAGGGGGFGGDIFDYGAGGAGGSAGAYITGAISVSPAQVITYNVGAYGIGSNTYSGGRTFAPDGGSTSLVSGSNTITAGGGGGGGNISGTYGNPNTAYARPGGIASATSSTGLSLNNGSQGANGGRGTNGYSSGSGGNGANSFSNIGIGGTATNGVNYGTLTPEGASNAAASGYGAGGGGGGWLDRNPSTRGNGGKGSNGKIVLTW